MHKHTPQKILIIQTAFIGDAILATSLLEELHHYHPEAELHILIRKGNETLFNNHPFVKKIWIWNKNERKYKNLLAIIRNIRAERFDLVVNLQRFFSTGLITAFSKAKVTAGFNKNPFSFLFKHSIPHQYHQHETERNHKLIQFYTNGQVFKPKLYPSAEDAKSVIQHQNHDYITIAPASVWFTKQYPKEKWIEFLDTIQKPIHVYLLGGPADIEICTFIKQNVNNPVLNIEILASKLSFLQTAALMSKATMNYVNDSAPLHIASSMNAPVRAIFCSTVKGFGFGPLSDNGRIIETSIRLDCRPCSIHGKKSCPKGHFKCATTISILPIS